MIVLVRVVSIAREVAGAAVGGAIGFFAFGWMFHQGYYAGMLPGGLLGLGCAAVARQPSLVRGILCGVAGLAAGLLAEGWYNYDENHPSLAYFFTHLNEISRVGWLFIGLGTVVAFWIGKDAGFRRVRPPADSAVGGGEHHA